MGTPEDYKGVFEILRGSGILTREFADRLKSWAGFRNILVHDYLEVDMRGIHEILQGDLHDLDEFIRVFGGFLAP